MALRANASPSSSSAREPSRRRRTTPTPSAEDPGKKLKLTGLVVGGVGVVSLGLGLYFGYEAGKISDDISNHKDTTVQWRSDIVAYQDRGQRDEYLQITLLIVGGAALATGGFLYVKGRSKSSEVTVAPTASTNSAGLSLSGSF